MRRGIVACLALLAAACDRGEPTEPVTRIDPDSEGAGARTETPAAQAVDSILPDTSACAETEGTVFSCKIRDGRTIAVCVRRDEQGREYAQYRFGEGGEPPELAWPTSFDGRGMEWASVPYSGGGEAQLSFARGDIRYVIYSRVIRTGFGKGGRNDPKFEDGAYVYRGDRRISALPCAGEADTPVSVAMAEHFAEQRSDLFTE